MPGKYCYFTITIYTTYDDLKKNRNISTCFVLILFIEIIQIKVHNDDNNNNSILFDYYCYWYCYYIRSQRPLTLGLLPPMAPGRIEPVSWYRQRILDTQPWETRSCREITQGRMPWWAISTILCRMWLGRGLPLMNTPPSWLTLPWPRGVDTAPQRTTDVSEKQATPRRFSKGLKGSPLSSGGLNEACDKELGSADATRFTRIINLDNV